MDAVMEFLAEGMREAPIALGALIGFALAGVWILLIGLPRERRRDREFQKKLDRAMGRTDDEDDA